MYWFLNKDKRLLYVGKAKRLKDRLLSYRHLEQLLPRTRKLVNSMDTVRFQTTHSELEALLLEAELIRLHQPAYNIRLKDDKSPLYIGITKEKYPRVLAVRKTNLLKDSSTYQTILGPYPSSSQVRRILKWVRRAFPYCNATPRQKETGRACLYHHIDLCPGACTGKVSPKVYAETIKQLTQFLKGERKALVKDLEKRIKDHAKTQNFEQAAKLKKQLDTINYISTHYKTKLKAEAIPNLTQDKLEEKLIHLKRLLAEHQSLPKKYRLDRIEAYDASNLQGKQPTVSMVVFTGGEPDKSEYKHFKIRSLNTPNDPAMIKEALKRRMNHPEWGTPDLIIIDGGKYQLRAALEAVGWHIPVVSIAKNPDRLVVPHQTKEGSVPEYTYITLNSSNPGAQLVQHLRDESHRFAKRLHKKLYQKKFTG